MTGILRIGVAHRGTGLAPVFAAIATSSLAQAGYEVRLIDVPGHPAALAALEAGEVDVINSTGIEVLLHNARHAGTAVVVASAIGRTAVKVFAARGWPVDRDLRDARWGVLQRADYDHCTALQVFDMEGWPTDALTLVEMPGSGGRLDRLLRPDLVDAVVLHAPEPTIARRKGWRLAVDLSLYDAPMQNSCAVVTRAMIDVRRSACLAYLAAYHAGVWRFRTDAAFGIRVLSEVSPTLDTEAIAESWQFFAVLMSGTIYPSRAGLRRASELLTQAGIVNVDYRAAMD
jgi:NitT/TauT family transport system substrate-binding protein